MKPRRFIAAILPLFLFAVTLHAFQPTNIPSFKPFLGLDYSPFTGSESPNFGPQPSAADIEYDLTNNLIFLATEIATYSMDGAQSNIPALCNTCHIQCYPCAFLSTNLEDNTNELAALIAVGNQNFPTTRGLIVGSEAMLAGYNVSDLIDQINYVRAATSNSVPVGTRDTAGEFFENPEIVSACDFIQADIHPYWAEMSENDAVAYTIQQWQELTNQFPGVRVEIGETGWPTGGTNALWDNPAVVPSVANQSAYLAQFIPVAQSMGIEYFIFDFRDESWKTQDGYGTIDTNWGVYYGTDVKKPSLTNFLSAGFTHQIISGNATNATLLVNTYESDPYLIYSTTNLTSSPWYLVSTFTATAGTNQTIVNVPNPDNSSAWFYRAGQDF